MSIPIQKEMGNEIELSENFELNGFKGKYYILFI